MKLEQLNNIGDIKRFLNGTGIVAFNVVTTKQKRYQWTVNKEAYVLAALDGFSGVPRLAGVIDGAALVMKRLDANTLSKTVPEKPSSKNTLTPAFFEQAAVLLATLHNAGITHGDLHSSNLLMDSAGRPVFIDFASALVDDRKMSRLKG